MSEERITLTLEERKDVELILRRRANDIADFSTRLNRFYEKLSGDNRMAGVEIPGSVDMALDREMQRLRSLAEKIAPPTQQTED